MNGTPSNEPHETIGNHGTASRPVLRQARRGEGRNGVRPHEGKTDTRSHETEMNEASKPTIESRNGETKRNETRDEHSRKDETQERREAESRRRRGEARNLTDGMTRHRPAIAKTRTGGQGATSQPTPTDETGAKNNDKEGNARNGGHGAKRGRVPTQANETRHSKQKKTRHERKTRTSGKTKANERSARERHDTIKASKPPSRPQPQIVIPFAHPTPGGGRGTD